MTERQRLAELQKQAGEVPQPQQQEQASLLPEPEDDDEDGEFEVMGSACPRLTLPSEREQQKKKELKERTKGSKPNKGQGRGAARGRGGKTDGGDISQPDRKFPRVSAVTASPALHQPTSAAPIIKQEKSEGVASASLRRPSSDSASVGTHASARTSGLNVVDKYLQELDIGKILSGQSVGDKA